MSWLVPFKMLSDDLSTCDMVSAFRYDADHQVFMSIWAGSPASTVHYSFSRISFRQYLDCRGFI